MKVKLEYQAESTKIASRKQTRNI